MKINEEEFKKELKTPNSEQSKLSDKELTELGEQLKRITLDLKRSPMKWNLRNR